MCAKQCLNIPVISHTCTLRNTCPHTSLSPTTSNSLTSFSLTSYSPTPHTLMSNHLLLTIYPHISLSHSTTSYTTHALMTHHLIAHNLPAHLTHVLTVHHPRSSGVCCPAGWGDPGVCLPQPGMNSRTCQHTGVRNRDTFLLA